MSDFKDMIGKRFLTPYKDSEGVVTVLSIQEPEYPFDTPLASVRFEGDHPAGYKDGSYGMYEAAMLRELPVSKQFDEHTTELHQAIPDPVERQGAIDRLVVEEAWLGNRGPDQERIAKEGLAWVSLLLRKNADYGSSAWKAPVLAPECDVDTAMRVRMSDKIERIQSLLSKDGAEVAEESIRDTIRDLGAYCLLWLACPK